MVLYIHVIATLTLVAAMGAEAVALGHFRRAAGRGHSPNSAGPIPGMRLMASVCLVVLFFSGGYLADRAGFWRMAWPKVAVAIVVVFGALAGLSSRRLKKIHRAWSRGELPDAEVACALQTRFLRISLGIRAGLVLAAVWLMTAKPSFLDSLGVVLAFVMISWGLAAFLKPSKQTDPAAGTRVEIGRSTR